MKARATARACRGSPRAYGAALAVLACASLAAGQFDPASISPELPAIAARFPDPDVAYRTPGLAERRDFATHDEAVAYVRALAAAHPDRVRVGEIGRSQDGREILAIRLAGPAPGKGARPVVLVVAQQHGNEPAGGEAALALAAELAGPRRALLDRATVLIVPRANPDGAARFARTTASGVDVNRDHLLLQTPEARALSRLSVRDRPQVVLDLHEFTVGDRWVRKFGVVERYDALLQAATVGNLPPRIGRAATRTFVPGIRGALTRAGQEPFTYHTTSPDPADRVVSMGGVQPDTGRNVNGLRHAVSLLIETRGVGIGRAHFLRRVHAHVVAALAAIEAAGRLGPRLIADQARADRETGTAACAGTLVIEATHAPRRQAMRFLDAATGADRRLIVDWRAAEPLQIVRSRSRPCGYLLSAGETMAVERLRALGLEVREVATAAAWRVERYAIRQTREGARQDARGAIDEGAKVRLATVATRPGVHGVEPGAFYVDLGQPLGTLAAVALEPDSQNSFYANRLLDLEGERLLRVMARPPAAAFSPPPPR